MKRYQIVMIGLVAVATMAASTMTSVAYRATTELTPKAQTLKPVSKAEEPISEPFIEVVQNSSQTGTKASEFTQFRQRLLDAVQRADTKFVQAIVTPQTQWSYGGTLNLDSYNINNNQSKFWSYMTKAVNQGCGIDSQAQVPDKEPGSSVWVCPDITRVKESIRPDRPNFGHLAVIGQNVNVRAEPGMGGRIIGSVSNDYVAFDSQAYNTLPAGVAEKMQADPLSGWTPVRLQNGQRGWILNQYVYDQENDYRVSFVRSRGQWRLRYFLPGNGN